jgi:protein-S-isoprenylcysteine O-methyltransferase Ste14
MGAVLDSNRNSRMRKSNMSSEESRSFDPWSAVVITSTLVLFLVSIFVKGFTHDLLLEAGVFLVSVKLILMAQKNSLSAQATAQQLDRLSSALEGIQAQFAQPRQ